MSAHLLIPGSDEEASFLDVYDGENKLVTHQGMVVVPPPDNPDKWKSLIAFGGMEVYLFFIAWYWSRKTPHSATPGNGYPPSRL